MKTRTSFKQFDLIIVPFPFIDSEGFNNEAKIVRCFMVTSSTSYTWTSDVEIVALRKAGLKNDCKIRFKVFSV